MNVGWIGLGKLGLPCALALVAAGHEVHGYDVNPWYQGVQNGRLTPPREEGLSELLDQGHKIIEHSSISNVVDESEVIFVAVQTPHAPQFDGDQLLPRGKNYIDPKLPGPVELRDFDYSFLTQAVRNVADAAQRLGKYVTIVVVSTALPGTFDRHLRPLSNFYTTFVYNPFFIAMGTTLHDFRNPEFVLIGVDEYNDQVHLLREVYEQVHQRPLRVMDIRSAELTKVAYNTFISAKIVFANTIMEMCAKGGGNCDVISDALAKATDRVVSPRYMFGGMGDGGHCHPRDLIAMSHYAQRLDLSFDLMGVLAEAREAQSEWLAQLVVEKSEVTKLPVVLLGKSYKPESDLVGGSPALLLAQQLQYKFMSWETLAHWDPVVDADKGGHTDRPCVFVICTKHELFRAKYEFPEGSFVIDPFGYVEDRPGVTVMQVGRN